MNWQYIAGFFDGEGSIAHNGTNYRITIAQTNYSVLKNINEFTGVGHVIKVAKRKKHWKDSWVYYISKQADVLFFLKNINKSLIVKRFLTLEVLPILIKQVSNHNSRILKRKLLIASAKGLRKKGLSYREIGKRLNIDFGHVRRLIIS